MGVGEAALQVQDEVPIGEGLAVGTSGACPERGKDGAGEFAKLGIRQARDRLCQGVTGFRRLPGFCD